MTPFFHLPAKNTRPCLSRSKITLKLHSCAYIPPSYRPCNHSCNWCVSSQGAGVRPSENGRWCLSSLTSAERGYVMAILGKWRDNSQSNEQHTEEYQSATYFKTGILCCTPLSWRHWLVSSWDQSEVNKLRLNHTTCFTCFTCLVDICLLPPIWKSSVRGWLLGSWLCKNNNESEIEDEK